MKKGPFKMKGFSYPGTSPVKNDKLEKVTISDVEKGYGDSFRESYDILVSKRTKNLIDAGAPKEVIEKSKAKDLAEFKKSKQIT